jgi:hypothetical protein
MAAGVGRAAGTLLNAGLAIGTVGVVGMTAALVKGIGAASDLAETVDFAAIVFGTSFGDMNKFADDLTARFGISKRAALEMAVGIAGLGKEIGGLQGDALVGFTKTMEQMAIDMSSALNMTAEEAARSIQITMAGNISDTMRSRGYVVTEETTKKFAEDKGIIKEGEALSQKQKLAVRMMMLDKMLADTKNNLAMTEESTANRQRKAMGMYESALVQLGTAVQPMWNGMLEVAASAMSGIGAWLQSNTGTFQTWGGTLMGWIDTVGWGIQNFGNLWKLAGLIVQEKLTNIVEYAQWGFGALGTWLGWFAENWPDVFQSTLDAAWAIISNFFLNLKNLGIAVWDFIKSGGTAGFNFEFTPLLQGFESSIRQLPEIAAPHLTNLQDQMAAVFDDINRQAAAGGAKPDPFAGNQSATEVAQAMLNGDGAAGGEGGAAGKGQQGARSVGLEEFAKSLQAGVFGDKTQKDQLKALEKIATNTDPTINGTGGKNGAFGLAAD